MNKDVEAPCKACGGLLPLKAIQTRRRGRHCRSCSLHPKQKQPGQGREKSRGKSSHRRQPEQGSTSQSKETRESTRSRQFSSSSDGQAEVTSSRNRLNYELGEQFQAAKPPVLEQFRAAFASQKAKKELTRCGIHRDQELSSEQKPNSPSQQASNQKKTLTPGDLDLHQHGAQSPNESICTRVLCHLRQEDASNSSSNPSVSTSLCKVRHVATQMSCKRLLAASKQTRSRDVQAEATAAISSQSGSASAKAYNRVHEAPEYHHNEECRSRAISPYPGVIHLYEECLVHHVEEHITASQGSSSRDSRKLQRRGNRSEQELHIQPQVIFTCHQRVRHQSVVQHHEVCHLHRDENHDLPAEQSPISRDPTTICGLPEPAKNDFPPQGTDARHSPTAYVKIESLCAQMITPRSGVTSPCILHGDCESESCGTCWHPKADHIDEERSRETPGELHKSSKKGKIHGCHLHRERPPSNPNCQDPFVWTPGPTRTPSTPVRWMDRMVASQTIPPQIVREFLQGRRGWPPGAMKQKCLGCRKKQTDEENSPRDPCEFDFTSLYPGSSVAQSALECAKNVHHDENLTRLLMARTQIIKPVVKLSTSKEVWRSRRELQFCSECWNPTKFGRWASILDEMSKDMSEVADTSRCDTKFSSCTAHGDPNPCDTGSVNLHRPELFSTFQLRLQAQKLQNETFDRSKALQACSSP
jgi:hypothetical protein